VSNRGQGPYTLTEIFHCLTQFLQSDAEVMSREGFIPLLLE
jgi:hypothetical protein